MFRGTLKPYQVEAVERMVRQKKMLVAYEMGLGKTPMTIAAVEELREQGALKGDFVLIVCLASLKYQWQKEITKFSDSTSLVIDGTKAKRVKQYAEATKHDYVIMNYEQVVSDWDIIRSAFPSAIICDEATAIKGFRAKRAKKVKDLSKNIHIRFALTGTPIENGKPEEIYSIMQFVDSSVLGKFDLFDKTFIVRNHFGGVQRYRNLPLLQKIIAESAVRKSQSDADVAPYLPDAVYREPLIISLDKRTQEVYDMISTDLYVVLKEAADSFGSSFNLASHYGQTWQADDPMNEMKGRIMSRIQALRTLCSHPDLMYESIANYEAGEGKGSAFIHSLKDNIEGLTKTPKMDATLSYLKEHLDIDLEYKAVVFSSFVSTAKKLAKELTDSGYEAQLYTGEMNAKAKDDAKTHFQESDKCRVLVSSDAGGYGVDLPFANLLINYDQPWSSGLLVQRNGRIVRASSDFKMVTIQDVLIKDSIEERQYEMLRQKANVADAILDGKGINNKGGVDLTVGSLIDFVQPRVRMV